MKKAFEKMIGFLVVAVVFMVPFEAAEAAEPVVLGVLHNEQFAYAEMMKNSYEMAAELVNKQGGIKGRPLKLVYANDKGQRKDGEKAVRQLIKDDQAVMLIGGYASSNTIYMAYTADDLDRPLVVCTASDDRITQRKMRNIYRLNPPASQYAKGLEQLMTERILPTSMAIIYENSPYGTGGAMQMMWFCREKDIEIIDIIPYVKERASPEYFKRILGQLALEPPDTIYMVSYLKDAVTLVKTLRALELTSLLMGGAGGFTHPKFINLAGDTGELLLTATLWAKELDFSAARAYYDDYFGKYNQEPDYHGAEAYSVVMVAADALKRAPSFSPETIRTALDQTDLETPFGQIKFDAYGTFERQNSQDTMVLQIVDGQFHSIWPLELANGQFVPPPSWRQQN